MDLLINSLPALLRAAGKNAEVATTAARVAWKHAAGELLSKNTAPSELRKHTLTVAVVDTVWQRQLQHISPQLIYKLNSLLGAGTIRFLEFHVDPAALQDNEVEPLKLIDREPLQLSAELMQAAAAIQDPRLRRSFLAAAASMLRRRQNQRSV